LKNSKSKIFKQKPQIILQTNISADRVRDLEDVASGDDTQKGLYVFMLQGLKTRFLLSTKGALQITSNSYSELANSLQKICDLFPDYIKSFRFGKEDASKIKPAHLSFLIRALRSLDSEFAYIPFPKEPKECKLQKDKVKEISSLIATNLRAILFSIRQISHCPNELRSFGEQYQRWIIEKVMSDLDEIVSIYSQLYSTDTVEKAIDDLEEIFSQFKVQTSTL